MITNGKKRSAHIHKDRLSALSRRKLTWHAAGCYCTIPIINRTRL